MCVGTLAAERGMRITVIYATALEFLTTSAVFAYHSAAGLADDLALVAQ